eukprot:186760-Hanusia_phi.AAC.1
MSYKLQQRQKCLKDGDKAGKLKCRITPVRYTEIKAQAQSLFNVVVMRGRGTRKDRGDERT